MSNQVHLKSLQGPTGKPGGVCKSSILLGGVGRVQGLDLRIPTFPSKTKSDRQLISVYVPIELDVSKDVRFTRETECRHQRTG